MVYVRETGVPSIRQDHFIHIIPSSPYSTTSVATPSRYFCILKSCVPRRFPLPSASEVSSTRHRDERRGGERRTSAMTYFYLLTTSSRSTTDRYDCTDKHQHKNNTATKPLFLVTVQFCHGRPKYASFCWVNRVRYQYKQ